MKNTPQRPRPGTSVPKPATDMAVPKPSPASPGSPKDVAAIQAPAGKGATLIRGGTASGSPGQLVRYWNRWRENYNALVELTIARVRVWLEQAQRGDMAYYQWTMRIVERRHPVLSALITCCEAPLENFQWDIVVKKELPEGATAEQAEAQRKALKAAYSQVDNLPEAILHLAHADFAGYAHIQKHYNAAGQVAHLECLFQYCICRDGLFGDWFWNPDSRTMTMPEYVLTDANRIGGEQLPREDFIIREVARPINEIALENFVRRKLVEKDWSAFDEIFGIPSGVIIMPGGIPPEKVAEYEAAARQIAEGGSGAMPNGSIYQPNDQPRDGSALFKTHMSSLDEDLVLAGTGGKLKMLVEQGRGGSGEGGGGNVRGSAKTQADTFLEIAAARGGQVAACFQRDFDAPLLARLFPGQPALVEFRLVTEDDQDIGALCTNVAALVPAGVKPDIDWLCEVTGYKLVVDKTPPTLPPVPMPGGLPREADHPEASRIKPDTVHNRLPGAPVPAHQVNALADALADDLAPLRAALAKIESITDDALFQKKLQEFIADGGPLVKLLADINAYPKSAKVIQDQTTANLATDLTNSRVGNRILNGNQNSGNFGHVGRPGQVGGSGSLGIKRIIKAAANPQDKSWEDWGEVSEAQAARYKSEAGVSVEGYKRVIAADDVRHALKEHAGDPRPVTEEQIQRLPEITSQATHVFRSERPSKGDRLISIKPENGHVIVVEEIRVGRKKLAFKSMHNHPSSDPEKVIRALRAITNRVSVGQTAGTDTDQLSDMYLLLKQELVKS